MATSSTRWCRWRCSPPSTAWSGWGWDIAAKYANGGTTAAKLAESIKRGGSGKWGPVPMPPQPTLPEADAQALATWILGQGPAKS